MSIRISQGHWDVIEARTGKSFDELKAFALEQPRETGPESIYFRADSINKTFCIDEPVNIRSVRKLIRLLAKLDAVFPEAFFEGPPSALFDNPWSGSTQNGAHRLPRSLRQSFGAIPNQMLAAPVVDSREQSRIVKHVSGIYVLYRLKGDHSGAAREWLLVERAQSEEVQVYWVTSKHRIYCGAIYKKANTAHVTFYRPAGAGSFSCRQMMLNVPSGDMGAARFRFLSGTLSRTKNSDASPMASDFIIERVDQTEEDIDLVTEKAAAYFDRRARQEIDDTANDHHQKLRTEISMPDYVPDLAENPILPQDRHWLIAELRPAVESCSPNQLKEKFQAAMAKGAPSSSTV